MIRALSSGLLNMTVMLYSLCQLMIEAANALIEPAAIVPGQDIRPAGVFYEQEHFNAGRFCADKFCLKTLPICGEISGQLIQIGFPLNNHLVG